VAILGRKALSQVRRSRSVDDVISTLGVCRVLRHLDDDAPATLYHSNSSLGAVDAKKASILSIVAGEVCCAPRDVPLEQISELAHGTTVYPSHSVDALNEIAVSALDLLCG
jgi:hypothetical protein